MVAWVMVYTSYGGEISASVHERVWALRRRSKAIVALQVRYSSIE
jgi:hypothetical protein